MQQAVRDALIAFMAATAQAQAEAKETQLRRDVDCRPSLALRTLAARSTLAIPTCPRGAKRRGTMPTSCRSRATAFASRHNPRNSQGPGPLEAGIGAANATS
jgi:hypothetical protein